MSLHTWAIVLLAGLTCAHGRGTQTPIETHPSIAQIEFTVATVWLQQAQGNIITNFHILTSAQSCQAQINNRRVLVGTDTRGTGGTVRAPALMTSHPSYDPETGRSDLCIIRLNATLLFTSYIYPVLILPQDFHIPENIAVETCGFGITAEGGNIPSNKLYCRELVTKSNTACAASHPGRVTSENICAGLLTSPGIDFDASDTGGSIYFANISSGILSFGAIRRNDEVPVVTQSTGAHSDWIVRTAV